MINVYLADDHEVVRNGLRQTIAGMEGFEVVGEADNAADAAQAIISGDMKVDVLITDISFGKTISGVDIIPNITNRTDTRILVFSMMPEEEYAIRTLHAGGHGFISKGCAVVEIRSALKAVASGKKYVSQHISDVILNGFGVPKLKTRHEGLSSREFEIMVMIAKGMKVSTIAEELNLSPRTVSTHRANIMGKMNFKSAAELAAYAARENLI